MSAPASEDAPPAASHVGGQGPNLVLLQALATPEVWKPTARRSRPTIA